MKNNRQSASYVTKKKVTLFDDSYLHIAQKSIRLTGVPLS
ncbi:hypothetical protein CPter291_4080 [Collimonas pratensis]|uniref:Uncharacterized protein n=1 Tax=Collimonas pratensis TaxID=279113 RepID=A0ABM5ZAW8_9BURK|nr:hypothetical protein CPter291_4080 [Collimonas pratensis]